jgi:hypothetical protein
VHTQQLCQVLNHLAAQRPSTTATAAVAADETAEPLQPLELELTKDLGTVGNWHTDDDDTVQQRQLVLSKLYAMLLQQEQQLPFISSEEFEQVLEALAQCMEDCLFRAASCADDYCDDSTLGKRVLLM